jgi:hypothetical protein
MSGSFIAHAQRRRGFEIEALAAKCALLCASNRRRLY